MTEIHNHCLYCRYPIPIGQVFCTACHNHSDAMSEYPPSRSAMQQSVLNEIVESEINRQNEVPLSTGEMK